MLLADTQGRQKSGNASESRRRRLQACLIGARWGPGKVDTAAAGTQGRLPQKGPQWHTDHFDLNQLEEQPAQEGHSDPPLSPPKTRRQISHVKRGPAGTRGKETLSPEIREEKRRKPHEQNLVTFLLIYYPSPNAVQNSLLIKTPNPTLQVSLPCQFLTNLLSV